MASRLGHAQFSSCSTARYVTKFRPEYFLPFLMLWVSLSPKKINAPPSVMLRTLPVAVGKQDYVWVFGCRREATAKHQNLILLPNSFRSHLPRRRNHDIIFTSCQTWPRACVRECFFAFVPLPTAPCLRTRVWVKFASAQVLTYSRKPSDQVAGYVTFLGPGCLEAHKDGDHGYVP